MSDNSNTDRWLLCTALDRNWVLKGGRRDLGQRASLVAKHWLMLWESLQPRWQRMAHFFSFICPSHTVGCSSLCAQISVWVCTSHNVLTCRMGLVCVFGKLVGLFSQRIKSLWERHFVPGRDLSLCSWKSLVSCWPSSSRLNRRWWWSRYAALRDRKRASHLWQKMGEGRRGKITKTMRNTWKRSLLSPFLLYKVRYYWCTNCLQHSFSRPPSPHLDWLVFIWPFFLLTSPPYVESFQRLREKQIQR